MIFSLICTVLGITPAAGSGVSSDDALALSYLIRAFQVRGHEIADLDPLGLHPRPDIRELNYEYYGFTEKDLDRQLVLPKNM